MDADLAGRTEQDCCIVRPLWVLTQQEEQSRFGLVYWGLTPQQQPGSYRGGGDDDDGDDVDDDDDDD